MPHPTAALAVLSFILVSASAATADPIVLGSGVIRTDHVVGVAPGTVDPTATGVFSLAMQLYPEPGPLEGLFNVPLTPADVGRTFRATAETDPAFAVVAAKLTNGVNDFFLHHLIFPDRAYGGTAMTESDLFRRGSGPLDFAGFTITALTFRPTYLNIEANTEFRAIKYDGVLSVEGLSMEPVPEPSMLLLTGTGAAVMMRRVRRKLKLRDGRAES